MSTQTCNYQTITCNGNTVYGNNNTIIGNGNTIIGNNNHAKGNGNVLRGLNVSSQGSGNLHLGVSSSQSQTNVAVDPEPLLNIMGWFINLMVIIIKIHLILTVMFLKILPLKLIIKKII